MSYSRNFGMRSFQNLVRDGRHRAPATGTPFAIGAPVEVDPANPGRLKAATDAKAPSQLCGLVLFEHIQLKGVDSAITTSSDKPFDEVPLGEYAQMIHGPGAKVWFKNTAAVTLYDGRTRPAAGLIDGTVEVGDGLVPDGAGKLRKAVTDELAWLTVEQVNTSTGMVEARFEF